jgi:hypothetical protein
VNTRQSCASIRRDVQCGLDLGVVYGCVCVVSRIRRLFSQKGVDSRQDPAAAFLIGCHKTSEGRFDRFDGIDTDSDLSEILFPVPRAYRNGEVLSKKYRPTQY